MLNIKQKSRPDNNTRLELNSCSACGKHYQRLVTKVCLFYIQHESSSCIFLMPVCAVCTAVLVSVVHILLKKIMRIRAFRQSLSAMRQGREPRILL